MVHEFENPPQELNICSQSLMWRKGKQQIMHLNEFIYLNALKDVMRLLVDDSITLGLNDNAWVLWSPSLTF